MDENVHYLIPELYKKFHFYLLQYKFHFFIEVTNYQGSKRIVKTIADKFIIIHWILHKITRL